MLRIEKVLGPLVVGLMVASCGGPAAPSPTAVPPASPPASAAATASASYVPATPRPTEDVTVRDGEEWVVFQWVTATGEGIYLVRRDGTGKHRIAEGSGTSQIHPDWSPDGMQLSFVAEVAGAATLWTINADGTGARQVFECEKPCNWLSYTDWSPDGTAVYFGMDANAAATGIPSTFQVARWDVATGTVTVVLEREDGMTAEQPRISPDGKLLAYVRFKDPAINSLGSAIFVAAVDGGKERQLSDWEMFGAYPDWSPDGQIVFNTRDLGAFQDTTEPANLYLVNADGSGLKQLTMFGPSETRATQPRWAPDGSGIVFTKVDGAGFGERRLGWVAPDGSGLTPLLPTSYDATHGAIRPIP